MNTQVSPNPFALSRLEQQIKELEENGSPECVKFAESLKEDMHKPGTVLYRHLRRKTVR